MPIDRVPFYTDEQFTSADLVTLQRNAERAVEDLAAFTQHPYDLPEVGNTPAGLEQPAAVVLGGLGIETSGTLLQVLPGLLSTTNVPSPDNPSRSGAYLAVNVERVDVPMPSPVGSGWYIVAGRPVLVNDAAVPRRVWDRPGKKWQDPTPSLVKQQTSAMAFDVVACPDPTQLSAVLPANSVPLWGVYRPGGGGAINSATEVVDLRPVRPTHQADAPGVHYLQNRWSYIAGDGLRLAVHLRLDQLELIAHTSGGMDPLDVKDPSDSAPVANEWWYLYLARHRELGSLCTPRHAQLNISGLVQQGLLIFSKVAPRDSNSPYARRASNTITPPLPFSTNETDGSDAALVLALRRNAANDGWLGGQGDGDHTVLAPIATSFTLPDGVSFPITSLAPPVGARTLDLIVEGPAAPSTLDILNGSIVLYQANYIGSGELHLDVQDVPIAGLTDLRITTDGVARIRGYRL